MIPNIMKAIYMKSTVTGDFFAILKNSTSKLCAPTQTRDNS